MWAPALGCGGDGDEQEPDASPPVDVVDAGPVKPTGQPLPHVPMKEVGDPLVIGAEPIALADVTADVGLSTAVGRAVAFVDFDDDGWPDIIAVAQSGLVIYRNVGGTFENLTPTLLVESDGPESVGRNASQTVLADVDGDGDLDLYVASQSNPDRLLSNDGFGRFDAADDSGVPAADSSQGISFSDVDRDGDLDLYVTRGRRWDADTLDPPLEDGFAGNPNVLLLNDGAGHFTDVTTAWSAAAGSGSETFGAVFADYDRDGFQDAIVVRDFRPDHFLRNLSGATFSDQSAVAISPHGTTLMGATVGDYNGDAHLDIYATDGAQDYLYKGHGDGTFQNVFAAVLDGADPTIGKVGWGCAFIDLDNDGDQDVVTIAAYDDKTSSSGSAQQAGGYAVLENDGGVLRDVTEEAGLFDSVSGQALAIADFDLDGDLDIVVGLEPGQGMAIDSPPGKTPYGIRLLRNESARAAGNRFLELSLRAESGNRFAIGAVVDVQAGDDVRASRVVTAGESHLSANNFVMHFGLSDWPVADLVTVSWPNGTKTRAHRVPAGYRRLAPHDGDCCWPGENCTPVVAECPVWYAKTDVCKGAPGCSLCTLSCERLEQCGPMDFDCASECKLAPPTPWEVSCLLEAECGAFESCGIDGAAPRGR